MRRRRTRRIPEDRKRTLLEDLTVLADGPSVILHLSFDRGLLTLRSHDRPVWKAESGNLWSGAEGPARAKLVLGWLSQAAAKYRELKRQEARNKEEAA